MTVFFTILVQHRYVEPSKKLSLERAVKIDALLDQSPEFSDEAYQQPVLTEKASGSASQIQAVIDSGAIRPHVDLVNNDLTDTEMRREERCCASVVSNTTGCGDDTQISILIEQGCVGGMV